MQTPSTDQITRLQAAASRAAASAYAPYSSFRVGAALLLSTGEIVSGCNVENASYGLTSCAERNAIFAAVQQHGSRIRVAAVAVTNLNNAASSPCGACRQVLAEFASCDAIVYFPGADGPVSARLGDLLPHSFKADSLPL